MIKIRKLFIVFTIICATICLKVNCDTVKTYTLPAWNLVNENKSIHLYNLRAPIGVYSALKDAYGDVLDSQNDEALRWIVNETWTFSTSFSSPMDNNTRVNLTFHGIDTVATIRLNGHVIGNTDNMFVRYSFDILPYLEINNVIEVEIQPPVLVAKERAEELMAKGINTPPNCPHEREKGECHRNMLRKMQMSFGGDWNLAAPSMGIWKPVDVEYYEVAIMRDIDVAIRRNDTHWTLDIRVFLSTGVRQNFYAELVFIAPGLLDSPVTLNKRLILYNSPKIEFKVHIPREKVITWWPNGYGEQKLYPLYFGAQCYSDQRGPTIKSRTQSHKNINIGFRTIELEEDVDDYGRSFYFKINGQPVFIKGASYVPSNILPELSSKESKMEHIIKSAKESHLNMIRIWGGGLYESDSFYNLTDHYGILVWQEMAFSGATYPMTDAFVKSTCLEVSQNARRLAFHPSLAMLVTNDEIELYLTKNKTELGEDAQRLEDEYKQMFMGTIRHELNIISRDDFNPRAGPMISTPSMGVEESKKDLSTEPQNPNYGDVHFWADDKDAWNPDIYPRARFITEYGVQSLPILASWNRTMYPDDDLSVLINHRQHDPKGFLPMMKLITRHFALPVMGWEENIDKLVYLSQVSQAMSVKTATDVFRSQRMHKRTMGAMYWQLNDAWVAPTWSSIDYFGNYKLIWYWSKQFMAPTSIIALFDHQNGRINVTVTKEELVKEIEEPEKFNVTMYIYLWSELYSRKSFTFEVSVGSNGIYTEYLQLSRIFDNIFNYNNCFLKFELTQNNKTISSTYLFPGKFSQAVGMTDPQIKVTFIPDNCQDKPANSGSKDYMYYSFTITVQKPALFVYLELYHPDIEKYKLSENGFVLTEPIKVIHAEIEVTNESCLTLTKEHVRVMTINQFYAGTSTLVPNEESTNADVMITATSAFLEAVTPPATASTVESDGNITLTVK